MCDITGMLYISVNYDKLILCPSSERAPQGSGWRGVAWRQEGGSSTPTLRSCGARAFGAG